MFITINNVNNAHDNNNNDNTNDDDDKWFSFLYVFCLITVIYCSSMNTKLNVFRR